MISEQYIQEGLRIRRIYIQNLKEILKLEPDIIKRKKDFDKIREQMENVVNSDLNEIRKSLELDTRLLELDKEIRNIQSTIKPHYDKIEELKKDSDKLYLAIKEKYPNITAQEIEQQIMSRAEE